ncbi:MAG: hypothetical protein HY596_04020 [Candidatus Omnitrophica bacterium]|nr:hypothetical protein [Candidatus Omnitrophota bacterium]
MPWDAAMGRVEIRFDPAFVEEAVFLALRARQQAGEGQPANAFFAEREALYTMQGGADEREAAFVRLARRYFEQLQLPALFRQRLEELPVVAQRVEIVLVRRVWNRKEERVELFVRPGASELIPATTVDIGLQAARILEPAWLVAFLRHELWHVADMLDPAFAYDPHPDAGGDASVAEQDLLRERFRLLWAVWTDGRMRRRGWPTPVQEAARRRAYDGAFAGWEPAHRDAAWQRLAARDNWTQQELLLQLVEVKRCGS